MSTNYYIIHSGIIKNNIPTEWAVQVHLTQYTANGYLLQAISGNTPFTKNAAKFNNVPYYTPVMYEIR